jgi:iron-sulfur cluster assembly protein
MKITRQTIIGDCITAHPDIADFLMGLGFHCVGCFAAAFETLEQGLQVHGKSDKEINEIIKRLNNIIENE